jgi:hypothetical protein
MSTDAGGEEVGRIRALQNLVQRPEVRTADRASMQSMLRKLRRGEELTYQERMNLFAYFNRYGIPTVNERHY